MLQKAYALFDFDGTLLSGDSIVRFLWYCKARGLCTWRDMLAGGAMAVAYYMHLTTAERSKQAGLRFLVGKTEAELSALAADFCREVLTPALFPDGLLELRKRREEGAEVLLITASPTFYLEPLKAQLGLTDIIGTRMDIRDGVMTGLICGENCKGVQKPLRLAEYLAAKGDRLDYERSSAYGDSASDEPMLSLCQHKFAVNPKKKLLKKLQKADGVTIVHWTSEHTKGGEAHARRT